MTNLITSVRRFLANEDGPTAVEYAVLVGLITVALVSIISGLHSRNKHHIQHGERHSKLGKFVLKRRFGSSA